MSSSMKAFLSFILNENFYNCTFIAHNLARFDAHFLLRSLLRINVEVEPLTDGNRILQLALPEFKINFIDSYLFIQIPLASFPNRFPDILQTVAKGHFPFSFNTPSKYSYDSNIPDLRPHYIDRFTKESNIPDIEEYHRNFAASGKKWTMKDQLYAYLKDDVATLRAGCVCLVQDFFQFQESLERVATLPFHVFSGYITISSFCHALFR